jgi:hypothetical protein
MPAEKKSDQPIPIFTFTHPPKAAHLHIDRQRLLCFLQSSMPAKKQPDQPLPIFTFTHQPKAAHFHIDRAKGYFASHKVRCLPKKSLINRYPFSHLHIRQRRHIYTLIAPKARSCPGSMFFRSGCASFEVQNHAVWNEKIF